jgi:hypothetical protein
MVVLAAALLNCGVSAAWSFHRPNSCHGYPPPRLLSAKQRSPFDSTLHGTTDNSPSSSSGSIETGTSSSTAETIAATIPDVVLQQPQSQQEQAPQLDAKQLDFVLGYLNKHHGEYLKKLAEAFSPLGSEMARANVWSGGSFVIQQAKIVHIDTTQVGLEVQIHQRSQKEDSIRQVQFSLRAHPVPERRRYYQHTNDVPDGDLDAVMVDNKVIRPRLPIDDIVRRLCRMAWIVDMPEVTGKLIQLAVQLGGAGIGKLPENMYLNQVPHNRYVRQYFYDGAAQAVLEAVIRCSNGQFTNRMQVISQFPEMNPSMDSYRIGTILEMVRAIAIRLAEENLRVRVCVQGSMGVGIFTGVPKQLSGVSRLVQMMDWQSASGEINEGMVGEYVRFGGVGPSHVLNTTKGTSGEIVQYQDDVFLIIAPQVSVERVWTLSKKNKEKSSCFPFLIELNNSFLI